MAFPFLHHDKLAHETLLAVCRAGFEPDLAAELQALGARSVELAPGYVTAAMAQGEVRNAGGHAFVFARQLLLASPRIIELPGNDRVTPLKGAAESFLDEHGVASVADVRVEFPDTNDGKALSRLAPVIEPRLTDALAAGGRHARDAAPAIRLHVFLFPERRARLALSRCEDTPWRNGIPRLRMPHEAPSRSTLKLAEAFSVFLGDELDRALRPDMRAVDLGAAPGGWTWQFVHRGVRVTAVDNGAMKGELADNAMVRHLRMDGFRYEPKQPVDWMVCDMVEKPARIAQLVATWMREQWCNAAIFNLKLPMKRRLEAVEQCRTVIAEALDDTGRRTELRIRQLYHDREEVTGFCRFLPRKGRS